jgi:protein-S-isoprenylcysteine O-methyltransferase Ste14
MLREERFLSQLYDGAYAEYCQRVGRYFPWWKYGRKPNAV